MQSDQKITRHTKLVNHMADALGVDVDEKMMQGALTPDELDAAVLRCTACTSPEDCEHWLDTRDGPVEDAPDYCRNVQLFEDLRAK